MGDEIFFSQWNLHWNYTQAGKSLFALKMGAISSSEGSFKPLAAPFCGLWGTAIPSRAPFPLQPDTWQWWPNLTIHRHLWKTVHVESQGGIVLRVWFCHSGEESGTLCWKYFPENTVIELVFSHCSGPFEVFTVLYDQLCSIILSCKH